MSGGTLQADFGAAGYITGLRQQARGAPSFAVPMVLGQSAVAVPLTGTLALTTLASVTMPGGMPGQNGAVCIEAIWSRVASAQSIITVLWGQATGVVLSAGTVVSGRQSQWFWNRGNEAAQVTHHPALVASTAGSASALVTTSINTAADQVIAIQAQLSNVGDLVTLEGWRIVVYPGA